MNIGIFGTGAIGGYLGGRLAERGHTVTFLARGRGAEDLRAHGMTLRDLGDAKPAHIAPADLRCVTDAKELAGSDVVLVCVKSAQTDDAGKALAGVVDGDTLVVSMQNGVRNAATLRERLGNVLGGIVGFNVLAEEGGVFRRATTGLLVIEASPHRHLAPLATALREAGFDTQVTDDITGQQWSKLLMNLNNAVGALTNATTRDVIFDPKHRRILRLVVNEALGVLKKAGVKPARLGPLPVSVFPIALALPTALLRVIARAQVKVDPNARSSMWQDLDRRRHTEVEWLNGEVVALAAKVGARAPINARVVALVHAAEEAGKGSPCIAPDDLYAMLTQA